MQGGPPRRRSARPVADAPIDSLLLRAEELTKGWLVALVEDAPLHDAPSILATDIAREGPRICDALVRALGSDEDLRRLEPRGALEPLVARTGALAGAQAPAAVSHAVDALRAVVWSALCDELGRSESDQVAALAERLTRVVELVRDAALRHASGDRTPTVRIRETPDRDQGTSTADPVWLSALDEEIRRAGREATPLSLLLVELEEADRVLAVETPPEATATFGRFARAIHSAIRRQDILAAENDARAWIIARDTGRAGAQLLADRLAAAVQSAEPWRGAPLTVSVGVAVLWEDASDRAGLVEAAEQASFAAASSGVSIVRSGPVDPSDGEPGGVTG